MLQVGWIIYPPPVDFLLKMFNFLIVFKNLIKYNTFFVLRIKDNNGAEIP